MGVQGKIGGGALTTFVVGTPFFRTPPPPPPKCNCCIGWVGDNEFWVGDNEFWVSGDSDEVETGCITVIDRAI